MRNELVRLALLLHDIGMPECYQEDEAGVGHFHGHGKVSQGIAESILMTFSMRPTIKSEAWAQISAVRISISLKTVQSQSG